MVDPEYAARTHDSLKVLEDLVDDVRRPVHGQAFHDDQARLVRIKTGCQKVFDPAMLPHVSGDGNEIVGCTTGYAKPSFTIS